MTDEHKNMKASPGLEIGLRPENGTYELCDKHYDASKTEAPEHCAVCSLQAKVEKLELKQLGRYDPDRVNKLVTELQAKVEALQTRRAEMFAVMDKMMALIPDRKFNEVVTMLAEIDPDYVPPKTGR